MKNTPQDINKIFAHLHMHTHTYVTYLCDTPQFCIKKQTKLEYRLKIKILKNVQLKTKIRSMHFNSKWEENKSNDNNNSGQHEQQRFSANPYEAAFWILAACLPDARTPLCDACSLTIFDLLAEVTTLHCLDVRM